MNVRSGLLVVMLAFLVERVGGAETSSGFCTGNQCFAVFQDPSDYQTAQNQCRDRGGHLMTLRSTVYQDIILVLLGTLTGRFWVGLHRSTSCPDSTAKLRGFEWVTGDNASDFFNWATSFDSSCSSHRCVVASDENDFKWIEEPCDQRAAGFVCEYTFSKPCRDLELKDRQTVAYTTPFGFERVDALSLPPGSIATRMPGDSKFICFAEQWLQAPWSCEIKEGGCEHKCAVDPKHVPSCYCPPGQTVSLANKVTCDGAIEDPCWTLNCTHACYKNGDSYACMCDQGYKLEKDGRTCVDFNDCKDRRQCPGENFVCINTVGGFQCVCKDGFTMTNGLCVEVDMCASAPCEHVCENIPGTYACSCYDGYREDPASPNMCTLYCGVEECVAECDPNDKFQCYCPEGYISDERGTETVCIDINECDYGYCEKGCTNTFGSYVCLCPPGYKLVDDYRCVKREGYVESTTIKTSPVPSPNPTRQPSGVTAGAFVGIILCTVFVIVLMVFLVHHILHKRGGTLKAPEIDHHGLRHVRSNT